MPRAWADTVTNRGHGLTRLPGVTVRGVEGDFPRDRINVVEVTAPWSWFWDCHLRGGASLIDGEDTPMAYKLIYEDGELVRTEPELAPSKTIDDLVPLTTNSPPSS